MNRVTTPRTLILWIAFISSVASGSELLPVPGPSDGDTWSQIPFSGVTLVEVPPIRFQQVYDAAAFSSINEDGGLITGVYFVSDVNIGRTWTADLPKVEISIGFTSRRPDQLSPIFADNYGSSMTVVHPVGAFELTSPDRGSFVRMR